MPTSVAEIKPPEIPPTHTAIIMAKDSRSSMPKVSGRSRDTASPPDSPGIAPNTMPTMVQTSIIKIIRGLNNAIICVKTWKSSFIM